MALHSFLTLLLLGVLQAVVGSPQGALTGVAPGSMEFLASQAPDLAQAQSTGGACGGCYLVADVAGIVFYSEAFVHTAATQQVSVGVGNGTRATKTSTIRNEGAFTYDAVAGETIGAALSTFAYGATVTVNGALLTSPTAYNVFTAYSVTSAVPINGVCSTVSGPRMAVSPAYSEILRQANGKVYLDENGEKEFIAQLGFTTCSGVGVSFNPTALVPISETTATVTNSYSANTPLAVLGGSVASSSNSSTPSASAPLLIIGNSTITPTPHPFNLPTLKIHNSSVAIASTGLVPLPTGTGTGTGGRNFSGPTVVPFVNMSPAWRQTDNVFFLAWTVGMIGFGVGVYYV